MSVVTISVHTFLDLVAKDHELSQLAGCKWIAFKVAGNEAEKNVRCSPDCPMLRSQRLLNPDRTVVRYVEYCYVGTDSGDVGYLIKESMFTIVCRKATPK